MFSLFTFQGFGDQLSDVIEHRGTGLALGDEVVLDPLSAREFEEVIAWLHLLIHRA